MVMVDGIHFHAAFHGLRRLPGWVYRASKMMIVMTNTKGGVGKSTLAAHLAIWLFDQGSRVALLDTDEQATAAGWIVAQAPIEIPANERRPPLPGNQAPPPRPKRPHAAGTPPAGLR